LEKGVRGFLRSNVSSKDEGDATGEKIDNAVKDAADAMEEAGEKLKENMD
jgi:hypothetical protein